MCWSDKPCMVIDDGCRLPRGYVMVRGSGSRGFRYAHRIAYRDRHGLTNEQMRGVSVLHRCDNPPCREPTHLFAGTALDNARDKVAKGRQHKGEQIVQAKLTEPDVLTIRAEYVRGSSTHGQYAMARRFGVTQGAVWSVVTRRSWLHI